jgi:hypothetical protein
MKTLTEFAAATLKNAIAKKQELTASGKTAEELPAAMGEALKLEGDKLTYLLAAIEATHEKINNDFKRVIVSSLNEGETAPSSARLIGEKYYTVESYPHSMKQSAPAARDEGRGGRGGRGGKGGRGDKDGKRGGGRGPRGPAQAAGGPAKPVSLPKPLSSPKSEPQA